MNSLSGGVWSARTRVVSYWMAPISATMQPMETQTSGMRAAETVSVLWTFGMAFLSK